MEFIDYYAVLGLALDADDKTIKTAYRKLARKYHPDLSKLPDTEEKCKQVAQAYEVLHSSEKRAESENSNALWAQLADKASFDPRREWNNYL